MDSARGSEFRLWVVVGLGLTIATLAAYWRVTGNGFLMFDDPEYVTANRHVLGGLRFDGIVWGFTHFHSANWHPLTWISHMADVTLYGKQAGGHHLTNLLLHISNTLLLLAFLGYTTRRLWPSALVAALFALHPLHVESVAWISERKDVLSTFFWFSTMLAYAFYARKPSVLRYAVVAGLLALGLMSKPMLVTLPFVLLLLDYWPLSRLEQLSGAGIWRMAKEKLPLAAMAVISAIVTLAAQHKAMFPGELMSLQSRITNAFVSYWRYIWEMLWPQGLAALYLHPNKPLYWQAAAAMIFVIAVTVAVVLVRGRYRFALTGWLWYVVTLIPVLGLVQVGRQSHADRYTYVPLTGIFIVLAWSLAELVNWKPRLRMYVVAVSVASLAALCAMTWYVTGFWHDDGALYTRAINVTRDNYRMMSNLGIHLMQTKDYDESLKVLNRSLEIKGDDAYTYNAIGTVMLRMGRYEEAERYYSKTIELQGDFDEAYANMGYVLWRQGKLEQAVGYFRRALELRDDWAEIHGCLGQVLVGLGRQEEGYAELKRAVEQNPDLAEVHFSLAGIYAARRQLASATHELEEAARISPDAQILSGLGTCYMMMDRYADAEKALRRVTEIEPNKASAHADLAAALAGIGSRDAAIGELRRAMELDPQNVDIKTQYQQLTGTDK